MPQKCQVLFGHKNWVPLRINHSISHQNRQGLNMGICFEATCRACGHHWSHDEGGGISFVQSVCGTCGSTLNMPRYAPDDDPPSMSKSALRDYVRDRSDDWGKSRRDFTPSERNTLERLFSHCGCGGNLYPEGHKRARVRCPECASSDLEKGKEIALYD